MQVDMTVISLILFTVINAYWTWQSKKLQNKDDVIKALKTELDLQRDENRNISLQYQNLLADNRLLHGENKTYKKFHQHPHN